MKIFIKEKNIEAKFSLQHSDEAEKDIRNMLIVLSDLNSKYSNELNKHIFKVLYFEYGLEKLTLHGHEVFNG